MSELTERLHELVAAITEGREAVLREFTMRVPAEPERDADLVISTAIAEIERLTKQRDIAITMLAEWCIAVDKNGTGWDDWDEHYKNAMYRPGPLRELLDKAIAGTCGIVAAT